MAGRQSRRGWGVMVSTTPKTLKRATDNPPLCSGRGGLFSQCSDPKAGNPALFPHGRGPQGDAIRIYNYVRLVRSETE